MLKKIGFIAIALVGGALALVPQQAKAEERFRDEIRRPAYTYQAYRDFDNCAPATIAVAPAPVVVERHFVRRDRRWNRDGRYDHDLRR